MVWTNFVEVRDAFLCTFKVCSLAAAVPFSFIRTQMMTVAPARPRPPWASKHSCPPASSHGRWVSRSGTAAARPADPVDASVASPCGWRPPPRESPSSGRPATRGVLKLQDDDRRRRETRAAAAARGAHFRGAPPPAWHDGWACAGMPPCSEDSNATSDLESREGRVAWLAAGRSTTAAGPTGGILASRDPT